MSSKLGAVRYGTEHGDPFLGRTMGTQADYSHEVAQIIDDEVRKLIEAAHTEAWEILTEYRDVLDRLAGELLEKETLHRAELQAIFADVKKRPRLTMFDDFGGRVPSDKPPIKTPGELAIERGEEWPKPVPEPAFKAAIAQASQEAAARQAHQNGTNGAGGNGAPANAPRQPDYGAPAGWHAPGWPPQDSHRPSTRRGIGTRRRSGNSPIRRISPIRSPDILPRRAAHQRRTRARTRVRTAAGRIHRLMADN